MSHLIILLCDACSLTDGSLCTCSDDKVSECVSGCMSSVVQPP